MSGKGGGPADWEKASTLVTRSCRLGYPDGCLLYADFFMKEGKLDKAVAAYNQACRMGQPLGCFSAGSMYAAGEGTARDPRRAAALNRRGCDGGAQEACVALAAQYAGGVGVKADQNESLALNQRACDGDNARACGNVGLHYELGIKRARDQAKAARLYRRACTLDKASCLRLGILFEAAGASQRRSARKSFERACEQPKTPFGALACGHLNRFYGRRGPVNIPRVGEVEKALAPQCGQKLSRACGLIGAALGVKGDPRAPKFLAAACGLGDGGACGMVRRTSGQRK